MAAGFVMTGRRAVFRIRPSSAPAGLVGGQDPQVRDVRRAAWRASGPDRPRGPSAAAGRERSAWSWRCPATASRVAAFAAWRCTAAGRRPPVRCPDAANSAASHAPQPGQHCPLTARSGEHRRRGPQLPPPRRRPLMAGTIRARASARRSSGPAACRMSGGGVALGVLPGPAVMGRTGPGDRQADAGADAHTQQRPAVFHSQGCCWGRTAAQRPDGESKLQPRPAGGRRQSCPPRSAPLCKAAWNASPSRASAGPHQRRGVPAFAAEGQTRHHAPWR